MELNKEYCRQTAEELIAFLEKSPTAFHAVENMAEILKEQGFTELYEGSAWEIKENGRYFVTRNHSSIIPLRCRERILQALRSWQATAIPLPLRLRKIRRWSLRDITSS